MFYDFVKIHWILKFTGSNRYEYGLGLFCRLKDWGESMI